MAQIHLVTPEYPPQLGGVSDYTQLVARALAGAGDDIHVWSPEGGTGDGDHSITVHPAMGRFRRQDLERAGALLDRYPAPRRLIVQWVPHGYGFRAMNVAFCLWLWRRAANGDQVEVMVHEPYLEFWEGTWRQTAAAAVHRVMTVILMRAARRVWISIPAWEAMWKPYGFGRPVPFTWLPIPSSVQAPAPDEVARLRQRVGGQSRLVVGHLGTYGPHIASMLMERLPAVLAHPARPRVLLIGAGSDTFLPRLLARCPDSADAVHASGTVTAGDLAAHVAACDVMVQPYPDGISARRTSAMAALLLGIPIVTTTGRLTEALWEASGAVKLSPVGDLAGFPDHVRQLLEHPDERRQMAHKARALYDELFDLRLTVAALRTAA